MDEYYNNIAPSYEGLHKEEQLIKLSLIRKELENLKIKFNSTDRLLDVGCGTGISTKFWGYTNIDKVGIDPAEKLIEIAQTKDLKSQYFIESAENLPFEDNLFDFVTSITAIQNFTNIIEGLQEIKRVAKKYIILTILKKSTHLEEIIKHIRDNLNIIKEIEEDKDLILICLKK